VKREPDFVITRDDGSPYLRRWWIIPRNRFINIYLHNMLGDDDDRALHDHPWVNVSIVLKGGYWEIMHDHMVWRQPGDVVFRLPNTAHRIILDNSCEPAWSLFITGPRVREWGFLCPQGWVHWKVFTKADSPGEIGKGCGE
jgi:hypothetical protein